MSKFHSQHESVTQDSMEPLVQLWLLRLLIRRGLFKKHYCNNRSHYSDDELVFSLADTFAIDMESCMLEDDDIDYKEVLKRLEKLYVNAEKKSKLATTPKCLAGNVRCLSALAGLSATDCRILEFAILIHTEEAWRRSAPCSVTWCRNRYSTFCRYCWTCRSLRYVTHWAKREPWPGPGCCRLIEAVRII